MPVIQSPNPRGAAGRVRASAAVGALFPAVSHASIFQGETLDRVADIMAIVVLIVVPIVLIAVFWIVHVMPEKIAHKRHHPQRDGIQTLCLLSLVFGGLLWPLAWLWAYTKPIGYRMAYGTDKHADYFHEVAAKFRAGQLSTAEIGHLRDELDAMAQSGALAPELRALRESLDRPLPAPPAVADVQPAKVQA